MKVHRPVTQLILIAGLVLPMPTVSQPSGSGFDVEPFRIYPSLGVDLKYDDNYLRSDINKTGTWLNVVNPGVRLSALKGPDAYNLFYEAEIGTVFYNNNYDFINHRFNANGNWDLGLRHRLRAEYEFLRWYDHPGSGDAETTSRTNFFSKHPDYWRSHRVEGLYSFGAPGAKGRVDLKLGQLYRRYLNNNQHPRDNNRTNVVGTFFARIFPKTSLLLELNYQDINYVNQLPGSLTLDSEEWRLYGGLTWDATAKTSGTVKVGYLVKDFDASQREDYDNLGWEVGLTWKPRTYSIVDISTSREPRESADVGVADTVVISALNLNWVHFWKPRLRTQLGGYFGLDDYFGSGRDDDAYSLKAGLFYEPTRWLEVGAEYKHQSRKSEVDFADFSNNIYTLTLNARY